MNNLRQIVQKPIGQVLLATLLFCFIFIALFVGLYKAGVSYIVKERSRRATDLTAMTAGAVYANGLQLVRETNIAALIATTYDIGVIVQKISPMFVGLPEDLPAIIPAALEADPKKRDQVHDLQKQLFGIGQIGYYPALIEGQTLATAGENHLSNLPVPFFAYNYETGTPQNIMVPNMALTFRTIADLLPDVQENQYSLKHDGIRYYFSENQVESAHNPRHPKQKRVRKSASLKFAHWWVRKEMNSDAQDADFLSRIAPMSVLKILKDNLLKNIVLDVTDRDDPPCHTFMLLGRMQANLSGKDRTFYQLSEVRVETNGLAAWDIGHPFDIYLTKPDAESFPALGDAMKTIQGLSGPGELFDKSGLSEAL